MTVILLVSPFQASPAGGASQDVEFFTEIEPAGSTLFTGDRIRIKVLASDGAAIGMDLVVEIVTGGKVAVASPVVVAAPGEVLRAGKHFFTATLSMVVDERLPPGVYRARARTGTAVSSFSEPFSVAPWGTSDGGVQVSLTAPAVLKSGDHPIVIITLRNTHNSALLVPSGAATPDCATRWLRFVVLDAGSGGRGLIDDRKDCKHQPMALLRPGETTTFNVDLGRFNEPAHYPRSPYRPARGPLRLQVSVGGAYYGADNSRPEVWKGRALSNRVTIEIK